MSKQQQATVSPRQETDERVKEVMDKIISYSREFRRERPNAPSWMCIEDGTGRLLGTNDQTQVAIVHRALAELAARSVFDQQVK